MDEILYELRDHSAGSQLRTLGLHLQLHQEIRNHPDYTLPERGGITMEQPFLRSYVELLIHTCHRRGIHAMGGMAAQIPIRNNPEANEEAMERVRQDKLREVRAGHDGTWVAHPGLVPVAKAVFDEYMPDPTRFSRLAQALPGLPAEPAGDSRWPHHRRRGSNAMLTLHCSTSSPGCVGMAAFPFTT